MYECACSCDAGDGEPVQVYRDRIVKASRKEHECHECGGAIGVGERYHYAFMVFNGDADGMHTCWTCYRIAQDMCGGCWNHGSLWNDLWYSNGLKPHEAPSDGDGWGSP